jgi:hypothetical protein
MRSVVRLNVLIFEWLDGGHVACLINFISPPAVSRLAAATTAERKEKNIYNDAVSKKKKEKNRTEQNIYLCSDDVDSQYRVAYEYIKKNCSMMKQKQHFISYT